MLEDMCRLLRNWFCLKRDVRRGEFVIEDGAIELPFLSAGQYFRIVGSVFNDGVYRYPAENLTDEVFKGEIWPMRVPPGALSLLTDIEAWREKHGEAAQSPYSAEVFGDYRYEKDDEKTTWQAVFKERLDAWRKL